MKPIIQLPVDIEQQKQPVGHEDLEKYRQLGIVQQFVLQADNDEDCELQWLEALTDGGRPDDQLWVAEPGADKVEGK